MSNKEEYERIQQVVGMGDYPEDREFIEKHGKKYSLSRNLFLITLYAMCFYVLQMGRLIPGNDLVQTTIMFIMLASAFYYNKQRKALNQDFESLVFRECWPDKGMSRYIGIVQILMNKQMVKSFLWNVVKYNFGWLFFNLGRINKASDCLGLMEGSCKTANSILMAEHLKQLIALYYKDYDTAIACAGEVNVLYPKLKKSARSNKIYGDMQLAGEYAYSCKNGDYRRACSVQSSPNEYPLDEVRRQYYLYCALMALNDVESAERCRQYVMENGGTTWYGRAVRDDFIPEERPLGYPRFNVSQDMLEKPDAIDKNRLKQSLLPVAVVLLFYLVPKFIG